MRAPRFALIAGFALLSATPIMAQTALRAPLSIVPPPMQAALGDTRIGNAGDAKLAPRVAARQMKRAVRAVAVTPGTDGDVVQVGQLGALEDAPVGLEVGLGDALWNGARLAFVVDQMARLPDRFALPGLYQLERRLHRGATAAPVGTVDGTSWFAARMMRLLALGDTQSAIDLEAETGAAGSDGYAARALVLAHLGRGDRAAACAVQRPKRGMSGRRDTLEFFMQMLVYCQLLDGAFEKAGLTLELNEKTLGKDALFRDMAYLIAAQAPLAFGTKADVEAAKAAQEEPPIVLPDELTPMQIALLQLAGQPLPDGLMNLPHYFMPAIAGDYAQPSALQLRAAHLAVRFGASPELFSQVAQLADLSAFAGPLPSQTVTQDAVFLAQALRVIDATPSPEQPRLVAHFLRRALARQLWHDMVRLLDDRLATLSVPQAAMAESGPDGETEAGAAVLFGAVSPLDEVEMDAAQIDNPQIGDLSPPEPAAAMPEPLADADRLILLLAHFQNGNRMAAENLMRLAPLDESLTRLARWQGYAPDTGDGADALVEVVEQLPGEAPLNAPLTVTLTAPLTALAVLETEALTAVPGEGMRYAPDAIDDTIANAREMAEKEILPSLDAALQPDWAAFEAQLANVGAAEALYMRRQLALYAALGVALPETLMSDLVLPVDDPVALRLNRLADNRWVGDLVLAQIAVLADKPAASYDAADTALLIAGLRRAGLQDEATQLAGNMLLAHTAQLVARAPHLFASANAGVPTAKPVPFQSELFGSPPTGMRGDGG